MNKNLFLSQLRIQLRGIPTEEIEEVMNDYESYFAEAKANNLSEEQAVANLGNPREIAKDIINQYHGQPESNGTTRNFIVVIGLIFFNVVFVLGFVLGGFGLFIGLSMAVISFILSPIFVLLSLTFQNVHLFELFVSFILLGIGLLAYPLLIQLGKFGFQLLQTYINWNVRMMKGDAS